VVSLEGDLGSGKTTLTRGIAAARARVSPEEVTSPTFALIHEYGDPPSVYHIDLYRLETRAEAERLGLDELFERTALVLIEWGDRFPGLLPHHHWVIRLGSGSGTARSIELYRPAE
jgi:tRNA threonylcarbamoyladenosine biosynthesis protein TsaE